MAKTPHQGIDDQDNTLTGKLGKDRLTGGDLINATDIENRLIGEGGNDKLTGGDNLNPGPSAIHNTLFGDDVDGGSGADDVLTGGNSTGGGIAENILYGDSANLFSAETGGNDNLTGGNNTGTGGVRNFMNGDADIMTSADPICPSQGGNDALIGGDNLAPDASGFVMNTMRGDANTMGSFATKGGDDILIGGDNTGTGGVGNLMLGDAEIMIDSAQGGNDTLIGGNSTGGGLVSNELMGEGIFFDSDNHAGDDVLVAGTAAAGSSVQNVMWGDAQIVVSATATPGHNTFVFKDNAAAGMTVGTDNTIFDFHHGLDVIQFVGVVGVSSFDDLNFDLTTSPGDTIIEAGADEVKLVGFTGTLHHADFLFG